MNGKVFQLGGEGSKWWSRTYCDRSFNLAIRPGPKALLQVTSLRDCAQATTGGEMYAAEYIRSTRMCRMCGIVGDNSNNYRNDGDTVPNPGVDVVKTSFKSQIF